jgi:chromosome segregation ATPase
MDEKNQKQPEQPSKTPRNNALLRYLTILFAVAFLLVLLSYLIQMRNMNTTVTELNRTSSSALSNAQMLQTTNQNLTEENAELKAELSAVNDELDALLASQETLNNEVEESKLSLQETQEALDALTEKEQETQTVREAEQAANGTLAKAVLAYESNDLEQLRALLDELSSQTDRLTGDGLALYDHLTNALDASSAESGAE